MARPVFGRARPSEEGGPKVSHLDRDRALVDTARTDPAQFDALYRRYLAQVYSYAYYELGDHHEAEDVTERTFLAALANLDRFEMRSAPALRVAIEEAQADGAPTMPKYDYPAEVVTAPMLARYSKYGIDFAVESRECEFIRALDMQREMGKGIYGSGYLIGGDALARRAEADRLAAMRGGGRM